MQMIRARAAFGQEPVVVAASGNESKTQVNPNFKIAASLPAAAEGVVSMGALQRAGDLFEVAPFPNILPEVSGPGVGIVSTCLGAACGRPARRAWLVRMSRVWRR